MKNPEWKMKTYDERWAMGNTDSLQEEKETPTPTEQLASDLVSHGGPKEELGTPAHVEMVSENLPPEAMVAVQEVPTTVAKEVINGQQESVVEIVDRDAGQEIEHNEIANNTIDPNDAQHTENKDLTPAGPNTLVHTKGVDDTIQKIEDTEAIMGIDPSKPEQYLLDIEGAFQSNMELFSSDQGSTTEIYARRRQALVNMIAMSEVLHEYPHLSQTLGNVFPGITFNSQRQPTKMLQEYLIKAMEQLETDHTNALNPRWQWEQYVVSSANKWFDQDISSASEFNEFIQGVINDSDFEIYSPDEVSHYLSMYKAMMSKKEDYFDFDKTNIESDNRVSRLTNLLRVGNTHQTSEWNNHFLGILFPKGIGGAVLKRRTEGDFREYEIAYSAVFDSFSTLYAKTMGSLTPKGETLSPEMVAGAFESVVTRDRNGLVVDVDFRGDNALASLAMIEAMIDLGESRYPLADTNSILKGYAEESIMNLTALGTLDELSIDPNTEEGKANMEIVKQALISAWSIKELFRGRNGQQLGTLHDSLGITGQAATILSSYTWLISDVLNLDNGFSVSPEGRLTSALLDTEGEEFTEEELILNAVSAVVSDVSALSQIRELLDLAQSPMTMGQINIGMAGNNIARGYNNRGGILTYSIENLLDPDSTINVNEWVGKISTELRNYDIVIPKKDDEDPIWNTLQEQVKEVLGEETYNNLATKDPILPAIAVLGAHMNAGDKSAIMISRLGTILEASQESENNISFNSLLRLMKPVDNYTISTSGVQTVENTMEITNQNSELEIVPLGISYEYTQSQNTDIETASENFFWNDGINVGPTQIIKRDAVPDPAVFYGANVLGNIEKRKDSYAKIQQDINTQKDWIRNNLRFELNNSIAQGGEAEWAKLVEKAIDHVYTELDGDIKEVIRTGRNSFKLPNGDMLLSVYRYILNSEKYEDVSLFGTRPEDWQGETIEQDGISYTTYLGNKDTLFQSKQGEDGKWYIHFNGRKTNWHGHANTMQTERIPTEWIGSFSKKQQERKEIMDLKNSVLNMPDEIVNRWNESDGAWDVTKMVFDMTLNPFSEIHHAGASVRTIIGAAREGIMNFTDWAFGPDELSEGEMSKIINPKEVK